MPDQALVQSVNDSSYLIHKPVAFNAAAAAGSPVFTSAQSPTSIGTGAFQFRPQTATQLGAIIHPQAQLQAAAAPQLLQTAMHYLTQPFLGQSYIFQYPSTGQPLSATTAAGPFSQSIFTNPFLQAGLTVNNEQPGQPITSTASVNQPAAAVNIAFIPGFHSQPGAALHLPTASLDANSHLLFNSTNANPHNFSTVPNLVSTAVVSAGQETAAVKLNSNQQTSLSAIDDDSSATISVSLKQMNKQNDLTTKIAPRPPTSSISISQVGPESKNLRKMKKSESKKSVQKTSKLTTKSLNEKQSQESAEKTTANASMRNQAITVSSSQVTNDLNKSKSSQTTNGHHSLNSESDLNVNSKTPANPLLPKDQFALLNGEKKIDQRQVGKNKSFAVGIRKNRGIKKSKKLSIFGCPIEVNDDNQTATPLGNATVIGPNVLTATIPSANRTMGFQKSFLPGLAPEPEPIGINHLKTVSNGIASNNNGWPILSKTNLPNHQRAETKKAPITTIYLQQEQPKTNSSNMSSLSLTNGNLASSKAPKASNGRDSVGTTASSGSLTITALGIASLTASSGGHGGGDGKGSDGGAGAPAGELQKQPLRKQTGQVKSRSVTQDSTTAVDVVIFRSKNGSNINELPKSNSSTVTLTVTGSSTEKPSPEHVHSSPDTFKNRDISPAGNLNVDSNEIVASSKKGSKNNSVKGTDSSRNVFSNSSSPQNKVEHPSPATHGWRWEGESKKKNVVINVSLAPFSDNFNAYLRSKLTI